MHFQNKIKKTIALTLCALVLSLTLSSAYTTPVQASSAQAITISKLYDMALTKTGIVANNSLLQKLQASTLNMLNGTASSYWEYCKANGLETNSESWSSYLDSEAYASSGFILPSWVLQSTYWLDWLFGGDLRGDIMESDVVQMMCGSAVATQGEEYTIKDDVVEYARDEFDTLVITEGIGYYYVDTLGVNDIPSNWFGDATSLSNIQEYVKSSEYPTIVYISYYYSSANPYTKYILFNNATNVNIVSPYGERDYIGWYNDDWTVFTNPVYEFNCNTQISICDNESFVAVANKDAPTATYIGYIYPSGMQDTNNVVAILTKDGIKCIVYTSLDALKQYNGGNKPYYQTTNNNYDTSSDNSVSFTGDYYNDNSNAYSYDIVQNEINNSSATTDNSVNNIVNDSSTTIINNYYVTGGTGGTGDSDTDSETNFVDGLKAFFEGISALLDFILGLIGDLAKLLTTFLDSALTLLKGVGSTFAGFSTLLGDMFQFIPQELIDLMCTAITLMVGLAIYKGIKG